MQARGTADEASALRVAGEIGLDVERLKAEMQDAAIQTEIDRNLELGKKLRVNGTPTLVFVDGQRLSGWRPAPQLSQLLDQAQANKQ